MSKIKLAVAGSAGRMGHELQKAIDENALVQLTVTTDKSDILVPDFDVLIDFTIPEASIAHMQFCVEHHKKMVIGTTGFSESQLTLIKQAATQIPIILAPNMSLGVNICFELLQHAAKLLQKGMGDDLDIHIIEAHHNKKIDAPSGTALKMGEVIAACLPEDKGQAIGFSSIRAGDIVGDHTVVFASKGERLEITHKASSRAAFAQGAVQAATWLAAQFQPGLYTMRDVLAIDVG